MRIGIDIRTANPVESGQQRYLWRLGTWLAEVGHDVHFLTVRSQPAEVDVPDSTTLHRLDDLSRSRLRRHVGALELETLLLNPERSRRYRGMNANVLRSAYGTEHYRQKLRSFRNPAELALRRSLRAAPWVLAERRWERAFYETHTPTPEVIAQSQYMKREILGSYRISEDRVRVVHNAVDIGEFSPARHAALRREMRERWAISPDALCLLFLGHNFRLKGLWGILRILPRLGRGAEDVHVLAVGRGTGRGQRRKAEALVERSGLHRQVTLAGPVRPSINALAVADVLVHLSWHDSFGFSALEAMACGLPVITTRYSGASELIQDGVSGLLVDPASDHDVIEAIRSLADADTRERIGAAAAAVATRHDEAGNFRRVLAVLEVAKARARGPVGA